MENNSSIKSEKEVTSPKSSENDNVSQLKESHSTKEKQNNSPFFTKSLKKEVQNEELIKQSSKKKEISIITPGKTSQILKTENKVNQTSNIKIEKEIVDLIKSISKEQHERLPEKSSKKIENKEIKENKDNKENNSSLVQEIMKSLIKPTDNEKSPLKKEKSSINKTKSPYFYKLCGLCNCEMTNKEKTKLLSCTHRYHESCLENKSQNSAKCYLCNSQETYNGRPAENSLKKTLTPIKNN